MIDPDKTETQTENERKKACVDVEIAADRSRVCESDRNGKKERKKAHTPNFENGTSTDLLNCTASSQQTEIRDYRLENKTQLEVNESTNDRVLTDDSQKVIVNSPTHRESENTDNNPRNDFFLRNSSSSACTNFPTLEVLTSSLFSSEVLDLKLGSPSA